MKVVIDLIIISRILNNNLATLDIEDHKEIEDTILQDIYATADLLEQEDEKNKIPK